MNHSNSNAMPDPPALSWNARSIQHISLHRRRPHPLPFQLGLEHVPFLFFYAFLSVQCYHTIGEPYTTALMERTRAFNAQNNSNPINSAFSPYYEDNALLPNPYLPAMFFLLTLLGTLLLHALLMLFQVWFIDVQAFVQFRRVHSLDIATHILVKPRAFKGQSSILSLESHTFDTQKRFFIFQRRKFIAQLRKSNDSHSFSIHIEKLTPPITQTIEEYGSSRGNTHILVQEKLTLYGRNSFSIPSPTFLDMFKQQLLEPLTVFQIFSVCLYMLDEYWQYSLFTLGMIVVFEGVTVLGRLKTFQSLGNMSVSAQSLYVFRDRQWNRISSEELVPGDILSLARSHTHSDTNGIVPCDCLLLFGAAIMNEATLTGESIPQRKECIQSQLRTSERSQSLDIKRTHKHHILFGGTSIVQSDCDPTAKNDSHTHSDSHNHSDSDNHSDIPMAPDNGCIAYVLRTSFSASQGKLLRMIERSSHRVSANATSYDAIRLLLLLLSFAIVASAYILHRGIQQNNRLTFDLVLRCAFILTSVIPGELPMQTSMHIHSAIVSLVRCAIVCTEPYRISLAGKVDICLFDKTGTLTTDQLTCVGVVCDEKGGGELQSALHSSQRAAFVLAGCHALVCLENKQFVGDPIEEASVRAIQYAYDHAKKRFRAKFHEERRGNAQEASVEIVHRYAFDSKLARMSVLARVSSEESRQSIVALVKGSPESIQSILAHTPQCYWETYRSLARRGMRVLALAYKEISLDENINGKPRSFAENQLIFAGFAAFQCLLRKDSGAIIQTLKKSSHAVSMITGDAMLTAVFVAKEAHILDRNALILEESMEWIDANTNEKVCTYERGDFVRLSKRFDLCVMGKSLLRAAEECEESVWNQLFHVRVFARMTPEWKEKVLVSLKQSNHFTLMCGDGGNDVGALKQAHIGVALLSGFGLANSENGRTRSKWKKKVIAVESEETLMKMHVSALRKRLAEKGIACSHVKEKTELVALLRNGSKPKPKPKPVMTNEEKKELMRKKQLQVEADVQERIARGESFARIRAMAAFAKREAAEAKRLRQSSNVASSATSAVLQQFQSDFDDGEVPMIKLGDASIASPFTSRAPSIRACVDIIRQGRCALVSTMQMYQILAIDCLVSSYSISVLYLDKVKYSNAQLMALGVVSTMATVTLGRTKPLEELSKVRPLNSIFHPALFVSLIGQFLLHLCCTIYLSERAKAFLEKDTGMSTGSTGLLTGSTGTKTEYQPNVLGTVVFLVNAVQTASVSAVNYKGRPFMQSMTDNPGLLYSLGICLVGVFLLCTETMPMFNKVLQVVVMPDIQFSRFLTMLLMLDVLGAFLWDQICVAVFAPQIFMASMRSVNGKDVKQIARMVLVSLLVIYLLSHIDYDEIQRQREILEKSAEAVSGSDSDSVAGSVITN